MNTITNPCQIPIRKAHISLLAEIVRNMSNISSDELNWAVEVYSAIKRGNKLDQRTRDEVVALWYKSQESEVSILEINAREQSVKDHINRIRRYNRLKRDGHPLRLQSHRRHTQCKMKQSKRTRRS